MAQDVLVQGKTSDDDSGLLDRPLTSMIRLDWETVAWILLIVVAIVTRFYDVGTRAMSHDESLHALYSYYLYDRGDYSHNPMMHGPFLFHVNSVLYFLFGVTDVTARIGPVLAGIATIFVTYGFRNYIGRFGALMAGILIVISPSLLFHSRYIRNDIYIALFTMLWIYGAFRYMDTRRFRYLMIMTLGMAFGFVSKENHFITGAIIGAYFAMLALRDLLDNGWTGLHESAAGTIAIIMMTLVLPFAAPVPFYLFGAEEVDWQAPASISNDIILRYTILVLILFAASIALAFFWFGLYSKESEGEEQDTPPSLSAQRLVPSFGNWALIAGVFWLTEILFFTTFLTNTRNGLATGIVGSLGYWLTQQDVARGSQPWYYYPMLGALYEFLPIILSGVGMVVLFYSVISRPRWDPVPEGDLPPELPVPERSTDKTKASKKAVQVATKNTGKKKQQKTDDPALAQQQYATLLRNNRVSFLLFAIWWVIASWLGYTIAGEKMPWLMTHMALPMAIFGGWYLGYLLKRIDWKMAIRSQAIWLVGVTPALLYTIFVLITEPPTFGREVGNLNSTLQWIVALLIAAGLIYLIGRWGTAAGWITAARLLAIGFVALLFLLTVRFSFMLTYINYDMATEYLVYAHAGPDVKRALNEIDQISERTVGGRNIQVAYDDDSSWPLSWYMRSYPNSVFYGANPNSGNMKAPIVIVGSKNYEKVRPYVVRDYVKRTYRLVWWPDQGYFNLTWERFWNGLTNPETLERIFQVAFYRRHRDDNDLSKWRDLTQWPNRHEFEMYIRRDVLAESSGGGAEVTLPDPIDEIDHMALIVYDGIYDGVGLVTPRAIAAGPGGLRVIADSGNHRLVLVDREGNLIRTIGGFCNLADPGASECVDPDGDGPLALGDGQFYEPWGVAVGEDGTIFVADTWNGRIQVLNANGSFRHKWGQFNSTNGELGDAYTMFGPRGIDVDLSGNLLVADTGNKRILHFTEEGEFINQVGGGGVILGRFEEPVDVAVDPNDSSIYVADAWNRRIQKLTPSLESIAEWPVRGWESQLIYHKPYVAVASNGDVYATDPEFYRTFVFSNNNAGKARLSFGNYGAEYNRFALPTGIDIDHEDEMVLIADPDNNRVMGFPLVP
ncbi:TIGR03663 family protein [Chloroflexi bacterium TSY]|nr:TIGR03663 family protein [Chloroflexi bacterium TSY]